MFEKVDDSAAFDHIRQTAQELAEAGWEQAVTVRKDEANVDVLLRAEQEPIQGLTVMVTEAESSAIFVNILGEIEPEALAKLASGSGLNLGSLSKVADRIESEWRDWAVTAAGNMT